MCVRERKRERVCERERGLECVREASEEESGEESVPVAFKPPSQEGAAGRPSSRSGIA